MSSTVHVKDEDLDVWLKAHPNVKLHESARIVAFDQTPPAKIREDIARKTIGLPPKDHSRVDNRSPAERAMANQIAESELPVSKQWPKQLQPIPSRKFRVDFAWPEYRVILEVDGTIHRTEEQFKKHFAR